MRRLAGLAAIAAIAASGCGGSSHHTIVGTMKIGSPDGVITGVGGACRGAGGFDDLREGAQVVVRDDRNDIVGTGELGAGRQDGWCDFAFRVKVPDRSVYQLEVSHRGAVTYSNAKLERAGWRVTLTV